MTLAERLAKERRARLAAERLLDLKQAELSAANRRLDKHAKSLVQRVHQTEEAADRVRHDLSAATEKAAVAERRLLSSVQALRSSFAVYDANGQLVFANDVFFSVFDGIDEVQPGITLKRVSEIIAEEGLVDIGSIPPGTWSLRFFENAMSRSPKPVEVRLWNERIIRLSFQRNVNGDLVNVGYDITSSVQRAAELDEARQKAEAANRAKSTFLANMSHEIRTPMNGVIGMAELLGETEVSEEQQLYVDTIRHSAEALLAIINDVLDYSKIEANRLVLNPVEFDLERCIHQISMMLQPTARAKGIKLLVDYDLFLPTCFVGDPGRIRQVLTNIVGNAVKFTNQGHVLLRVTGHAHDTGDADIHVTVEDTGIGIAEDQVDRIFGEFNQVEDERNRSYEGTGLGLTISRKLVELMDGKIWVDSEVDVGSSFGFQLCLPVAGTGPVDRPVLPSRIRKVLIVDPHEVNRTLITRRFEALGASVLAEADAHAALDVLPGQFDLIVTDHQMPDMDGLELAAEIRRLGMTIPIVMFSNSPAVVDDAPNRDDLAAVLLRPVPHATFVEALRKLGADIAPQDTPPALQEVAPVPEPEPRDVPQTDPRQGRRMRVLTAEDNRTNRLVFEKMTRECDIDLFFATDGEEAVAMVAEHRPDLVFMDISMPRMDGKSATQAIRRTEEDAGTHLPIVALTAHAMSGDREEILDAGLDDYLTKPLRKTEILRLIMAHAPGDARPPVTAPAPLQSLDGSVRSQAVSG